MQSSDERILFLLKTRGPQTAAMLSHQLGITAVGARQHLNALSERRLVEREDRRESVGRPKRYWRLSAQAQSRFPDSHAFLTLELLQAALDEFGADGLERLIARREADSLASYRLQLADCDSLAQRVARLAELRDREGYMAEWREPENGVFLLIENHCPVCAAARQCQGLCRSELQLFRAVLGAQTRVERIDHLLAGARRCAYRIEAIQRPTGRRGPLRSRRPRPSALPDGAES